MKPSDQLGSWTNFFHWKLRIFEIIRNSVVEWSYKLWYPNFISNKDENPDWKKWYIYTLDKENICYLVDQNIGKYIYFQELFELKKNENFLPPHQLWDYKIKFKENKQFGKYAIYPLSDFKLKILRKYFDKILRCSFIWEL